MLADVLRNHRGALRASLLAEYHLRLDDALKTMGARELGELAWYLPPGCAMWKSIGGPMAWSDTVAELKQVNFHLRVIAWQKTEDAKHRRNVPEMEAPPAYAFEHRREDQAIERRAAKFLARQRKRKGMAT